jgi:glycosyltransferase involved in cell wall biosynthesis
MTQHPPEKRPLVMRIITRLAGGGPPVHATILNRRLPELGFDSVLVFGNCAETEKNMEYLLQPDDQIERIPELGAAPSPLHDLLALYKLWRLIRRYKPDIVHTHTAKAGFLGRIAAWLAACPHVIHTFHGHVLEGYFSPRVNQAVQFAERSLGALSEALLTVSKQQADELSHRFAVAPESKFHVVPLGLDLGPYLELPPPDFHAAKLQLLWLGRFVPIKNLELLLKIAVHLQAKSLPVEITLAGEGPLKPEFEAALAQHGLRNVTLLPWQDDIRPVLAQSHMLIMTSHREGTPLSLIQGMASGRPFLSTAAGGTVDLGTGIPRLERDSWWYDNAILAASNPDAFRSVLAKLLAQRAWLERMSRHSRRFAAEQFSEVRLAEDIAQLYNGLIGAPSAQARSAFGVRV